MSQGRLNKTKYAFHWALKVWVLGMCLLMSSVSHAQSGTRRAGSMPEDRGEMAGSQKLRETRFVREAFTPRGQALFLKFARIKDHTAGNELKNRFVKYQDVRSNNWKKIQRDMLGKKILKGLSTRGLSGTAYTHQGIVQYQRPSDKPLEVNLDQLIEDKKIDSADIIAYQVHDPSLRDSKDPKVYYLSQLFDTLESMKSSPQEKARDYKHFLLIANALYEEKMSFANDLKASGDSNSFHASGLDYFYNFTCKWTKRLENEEQTVLAYVQEKVKQQDPGFKIPGALKRCDPLANAVYQPGGRIASRHVCSDPAQCETCEKLTEDVEDVTVRLEREQKEKDRVKTQAADAALMKEGLSAVFQKHLKMGRVIPTIQDAIQSCKAEVLFCDGGRYTIPSGMNVQRSCVKINRFICQLSNSCPGHKDCRKLDVWRNRMTQQDRRNSRMRH